MDLPRRGALKAAATMFGLSGLSGCSTDPETPSETERTRTRTERTASPPETEATPEDRASPTPGRKKPKSTPERTKSDGTSEGVLKPAGLDFRFDRAVNAVDDLGMDPAGEEPIDNALDASVETGTLIEFPPGTYLATDTHEITGDLDRWGMRGLGETPTDVRIRPTRGQALRFLKVMPKSVDDLLVENLAFDQRRDFRSGIGNVVRTRTTGVIRNVHYTGWAGNSLLGSERSRLHCYAETDHADIVIDGLVKTGREWLVSYPNSSIMLFSGPGHNGTLTIRNSRIENCGEHAIYASRCPGSVRIENCYFENNQNTHVRVSGSNSWVRDSTFVWTENHPNAGEFQSQTGLMWESGFQGFSGGLVEGCEFVCASDATNSGVLKVDGSHGGVTVRDCRFRVDGDGAEPIWADAPGDSHMIDGKPEKPWGLAIENVSITGTGSTRGSHTGAIQINQRDGSVIRDSCIHMTGDRDGIVIADSNWCRIADTAIGVNGQATVFQDSIVTTSDTTHADSCPRPDATGARSEPGSRR